MWGSVGGLLCRGIGGKSAVHISGLNLGSNRFSRPNDLTPKFPWKSSPVHLTPSPSIFRRGCAQLRPLHPRDSHKSKVLDFRQDTILRNRYINPFGELRFGFLMEELDFMAGVVAYSHALHNSVPIEELLIKPGKGNFQRLLISKQSISVFYVHYYVHVH